MAAATSGHGRGQAAGADIVGAAERAPLTERWAERHGIDAVRCLAWAET
ncbi:hypothetical protein [Streptomyces sp. NBC_00539]|nr:hypothetical protein [Streptomyces sp. NBC_00539]WUC69208.1 hypothetical protein OG861_33770 [Streptomyces sp. NBC_00539]